MMERLTPKKILDILYAREGRHLVLKAMKECIDGWAASPGDLHTATLARYNRCHGLVETVIRDVYNKEDVAFSELDRKFITAFEDLKETRGAADHSCGRSPECFRKVLKVAQQKGWREHGKFLEELGQLCVKKEETYPSFLDWDELRTVMETDMRRTFGAGEGCVRLLRSHRTFLSGDKHPFVRRTCLGMTKEHRGFAGHVLKERRLETVVQAVFLFLNRQWSCWRNTKAGIR